MKEKGEIMSIKRMLNSNKLFAKRYEITKVEVGQTMVQIICKKKTKDKRCIYGT